MVVQLYTVWLYEWYVYLTAESNTVNFLNLEKLMLLKVYLKVLDVLFNQVIFVKCNDRASDSIKVREVQLLFVFGHIIWGIHFYIPDAQKHMS